MAFSKFLFLFTLFLFQTKLFVDFDPILQVVPFSVCQKIFQSSCARVRGQKKTQAAATRAV